jgi:Putative Actinobacterial Holin-X, holin superfamily III
MHTPADERDRGLQAAVHDVAERARALTRLEVELASLELRRKTAAFGTGAALIAAGGVLALFAVGFLLATAAAALATVVPTWSALLVVGGTLLVVAAVLVAIGTSRLRRGVPPVPEQALEEAKLTGAALAKARNGA